jgi:phosphomevalonate kinase
MTTCEPHPFGVTASAPGKLVLSGEYAVLDGAPAIAVAVNRRATVAVAGSEAACHSVVSPGYLDTEGRFQTAGEGIEWLAGAQDYALVGHVWSALGFRAPAPLALRLDSRAFLDPATGIKLGIGSSAAIAVALAAALAGAGEAREEVFFAALDGHRRLQGGLGSGVDVACSLLGGLIEYSLTAAPGRRLAWPEGLEMAVFWVGAPASTSERIGKLGEVAARPSRSGLAAASERIAAAWAGGSAPAVIDEYRDYVRVLREFSDDHHLGIFDAGHAELAADAEAVGLVYKPCGAGGGDTGVCLATDPDALAEFLSGEAANRAHRPAILPDPLGVEVGRGEP